MKVSVQADPFYSLDLKFSFMWLASSSPPPIPSWLQPYSQYTFRGLHLFWVNQSNIDALSLNVFLFLLSIKVMRLALIIPNQIYPTCASAKQLIPWSHGTPSASLDIDNKGRVYPGNGTKVELSI